MLRAAQHGAEPKPEASPMIVYPKANPLGSETDAMMAVLGILPVLSEEGCFRRVYASRGIVYKVPRYDTPEDRSDQYRETVFFLHMSRCRCGIARYATPTTLYSIGGILVTAQPQYPGGTPDRASIVEMARIVRNHNAHGHEPIIADLREGNYMLDAHGNLRITDGNLNPSEYSFLVETDTSGRLAGSY